MMRTEENDDGTISVFVRTGIEDFEPLREPGATHEDKILHALEYIADKIGYLAQKKFEESR
jgi:hypothetical protein